MSFFVCYRFRQRSLRPRLWLSITNLWLQQERSFRKSSTASPPMCSRAGRGSVSLGWRQWSNHRAGHRAAVTVSAFRIPWFWASWFFLNDWKSEFTALHILYSSCYVSSKWEWHKSWSGVTEAVNGCMVFSSCYSYLSDVWHLVHPCFWGAWVFQLEFFPSFLIKEKSEARNVIQKYS